MACGCSQSPEAIASTRTNAARCGMCIYATHGPDAINQGAVLCYDGVPIVGRTACPRGYFGDGFVRWLGVKWYGLPAPMRWFLWAMKRTHPASRSFSGCGCSVRLKSAWEGRK